MTTNLKAKAKVAGQKTKTHTYVDIEGMTPQEIAQLEKDPPVIKTARKHMKMVNNKAMEQFGKEAFGLQKSSQHSLMTTARDHSHDPTKYASQQRRADNISVSPQRERTKH